jgi:hypothetical protein
MIFRLVVLQNRFNYLSILKKIAFVFSFLLVYLHLRSLLWSSLITSIFFCSLQLLSPILFKVKFFKEKRLESRSLLLVDASLLLRQDIERKSDKLCPPLASTLKGSKDFQQGDVLQCSICRVVKISKIFCN